MVEAPIRVLVVGAGYFSQFHQQAWSDDPRATLVGIVDSDTSRARKAAAAFDDVLAFDNLEKAIEATTPELVDIVTPPKTHLALIRITMAYNIATICQKPLCGGLERALQAVALAYDANVPLVVHENFRFQPWYRKLDELIRAGQMGDLYQMTFRLRPGDGQGPDAYLDRQPYFQRMERFLVHETATHFIDTFRFLLGEPDWVWADLRRLNPAIRGEDAGTIVFGYRDGRCGLFDGNRLVDHVAQNHRYTMGEALIEGSFASAMLDGDGQVMLRLHGSNETSNIATGAVAGVFGGGCVAALQAHVIAHMLDGALLENEARDYVRNLRIVEAIYSSAKSGNRVMLDGEPIAEGATT